jgi:hypothetical protein
MDSTTLNGFGIFGDEVFTSTDLNRRSGEVLNHARLRPVTISRNNEQFALLRREQAAKLVHSFNKIQGGLAILVGVDAAISGRDLPPSVSWLRIYEKDDLQKLHTELLHAMAQVVFGSEEWGYVDAVIHEWKESAVVAQNGLLDSVMYNSSEEEELPLPSPEEMLRLVNEAEAECAAK